MARPSPCSPVCRICFFAMWPSTIAAGEKMKANTSARMAIVLVPVAGAYGGGYCWPP